MILPSARMRTASRARSLGWLGAAILCALVAGSASPLLGQATNLPPIVTMSPPGSRIVAGVVADTGDIPIDSVEVVIGSYERKLFGGTGPFQIDKRTRTNAKGEFRFTGVSNGEYEVRARRLGFAPQSRKITQVSEGVAIKFSLLPLVRALPARVTSVLRGGISGVVGDTTYAALAGADVRILASDKRVTADSVGQFWLDAKPGKYMLSIQKPGYLNKTVSVTVPNDSGRRVIVWLTPGRNSNREGFILDAISHRMAVKRSSASFFTREDIERLKVEEVLQLAKMGSTTPVRSDCMAIVDGYYSQFLYEIVTDEVESVEVYPPGSLPSADGRISRTTPPRSINSGLQQRRPSAPVAGCPMTYVWMKK